MSEENKAFARRADEELFNRGSLDVANELFAPNFVFHDPASGEDWHGPDSVKQYATMLRAAFPDLYYTVEDQIAEGDKVVTRWTVRGTHQGEIEEFGPPTGKQVELEGITIHRIEGGKIVEEWERYDNLSVMLQLGLVNQGVTP